MNSNKNSIFNQTRLKEALPKVVWPEYLPDDESIKYKYGDIGNGFEKDDAHPNCVNVDVDRVITQLGGSKLVSETSQTVSCYWLP